MSTYRRVLSVQDISCVGQCSLTVALPILSACGAETCVLPSAVLSTHTGGFSGFTFRDLTDDMPAILAHWQKEGIDFDAIYTGYLGSTKQIDYVKAIFDGVAAEGCVRVVDPAMADHGKLYTGFDMAFVDAMKTLCGKADYVIYMSLGDKICGVAVVGNENAPVTVGALEQLDKSVKVLCYRSLSDHYPLTLAYLFDRLVIIRALVVGLDTRRYIFIKALARKKPLSCKS